MVGTSLSHYQITDELGRGGMGIVYKATDTKLDRMVAIKVLPSAALADDDDRARFYREAKAAAQLHHPNIASVFEIDEAVPSDAPHGTQASPFIAMEYVDGESLAARIKKAPLNIKQAVDLSIQIARALEAAHEKTIVHRDIKSANVMLTAKGEAKVLDFGLAKTTHSTMLTRMGSTLGTIAYMSPEQARGEEVDHRTDLWALGITLYEMVVGHHPYPGDYEQAVVYSILNLDPEPLTAVRTGVPIELERITQKLLRKDAAHRYQTAGDLIADLRAMDLASIASSSSLRPPAASTPSKRSSKTIVWMGAALVITTGLALASFFSQPSVPPPLQLKSNIFLTGSAGFNYFQPFHLSPDEQSMVYVSWPALDGGRLWIRNMATGEERPIADTEGAESPFWSADGEQNGYLSQNYMKAVSIAGGPSRSIETGSHFITSAAWGSQGTILFRTPEGLFSFSELDGSDILAFTVEDLRSIGGRPTFHPNGVDFVMSRSGPGPVFQGAIGRSEFTEVASVAGAHIANPDWMVYLEFEDLDATVFKQHYDVDNKSFSGTPEALFASLWTPGGRGALSVRDKTILYVEHERLGTGTMRYQWYDLDGKASQDTITVEPDAWKRSLSPDGSRWAVSGQAMYVYNFERDLLQDYQFPNFTLQHSWSSDSQKLLYLQESDFNIFNFSNDVNSVVFSSAVSRPREVHWVPSDSVILFTSLNTDEHRSELWMADMESDLEVELLDTEPNVYRARVSPDRKWIAYESGNSPSTKQVYLRSWPDLGAPTAVSRSGANQITWNGASDQIFYINRSGKMEYSTLSESGGRLQITTNVIPVDRVQFDPFRKEQTAFSLHPDGDRVLLSISGADHPQFSIPLEVIRDW